MFSWLRSLFARREPAPRPEPAAQPEPAPGPESRPIVIRAKYDAAQTGTENSRHWANTDALSAREANSLDVRTKLRERARYEVANNSYAKGIILTLANNLVGAGPRLQVTTPNAGVNAAIEVAFAKWMQAVRMPDQLRTMVHAKKTDGEPFGIFVTNPAIQSPVQLDIRLIECDQVTDGEYTGVGDPLVCDGIRYDTYGNPVSYDVLRRHPGDRWGIYGEYDRLPARNVLHWFRCDRPGQLRGIPEITPALPLFALLRRFALATLSAAEIAASWGALVKTTGAPYDGSNAAVGGDPTDMPEFEINRGMVTFLPEGWEPFQLKAEHPATTHDMFVWCVLREIARCLNIPIHVAAGDYSDSNYATARLGSQDFRLAVKVEREDCEREVLDPTLARWLDEAVMIPDLLPAGSDAFLAELPHVWHWPAWDYIDPMTEAQADAARLESGTTTLAEVCAARGQDWQQVIRQRAIERAYAAQVERELGIAPEPATSAKEDAPTTEQGASQ